MKTKTIKEIKNFVIDDILLPSIGVGAILGTIALSSLTNSGCESPEIVRGLYNNYNVTIRKSQRDGDGKGEIIIRKKQTRPFEGNQVILAYDKNKNGKFDYNEINSMSLPKGHPLEKYANPDSLEVAYKEVVNQK